MGRPDVDITMNLLERNAACVRKMTGLEIWLSIAGRGLVALGVGILAMAYFPRIAFYAAVPLVVVGLALFLFALKGQSRRDSNVRK